MKSLLTLLALTSIGLGVAACGAGSRGTGLASRASSQGVGTAPTQRYLNDADRDDSSSGDTDQDGDNSKDTDNDSYSDYMPIDNASYHDGDDNKFVAYGHAASAADRQVIAALVKRYYAAAAAGNGAAACRLIDPTLARTIPGSYGQPPGPIYARGKSCSVVASKLFKHLPTQADLAGVEATDVRVEGDEAFALLGSPTIPASFLALKRDGGAWRIDSLIARTLP
jgi:hypothetical protein